MAALKNCTAYILLTIALIWNYSARPSNAESVCEFDSQMTYAEKPELCPNGATGLKLCEPGQLKIKPCISADEDTTDICEVCPYKFFQANFNNCTNCHECSECGMNERVKTVCTSASNTVCESIFPETITSSTSQESTTTPSRASVSTRDSKTDESSVAMTTCKTTQSSDKKTIATESGAITPTEIKGSGNRAPENGLSHGGRIAIIVISVIVGLVVLVGCFLWNCPLRNNNQQPNAGDGGTHPNNGPQGVPLVPKNGDAAARPEAND
ncbi:uncharacterized protein [Diadema antillarum]|uniref:uncharacterized protein n=1 Tax=Diadema antillarum TaxID=105358 RepID=UPI003A84758F